MWPGDDPLLAEEGLLFCFLPKYVKHYFVIKKKTMLKAETFVDITDFHKNVITVPRHKFIRNTLAFNQNGNTKLYTL